MAFCPRMRSRSFTGGGLLLAAIAMVPLPLAAAPLEKEVCNQLQAEKQSLVLLGVEKDMAKGPEWAKANLKSAQLDLVKRYLTVDEQLKFRCRPALARPATLPAKAAIIRARALRNAKQAKAAQATSEVAKTPPAKAEPASKPGK